MSFKGIVTRKDKDTGVELLAKIVTGNNKKSTKKKFKVKVKANALSDFECCVIDLATARSKVLNNVDISDVKNDIPMTYYGLNGTTIKYNIVDLDSGKNKLSKYLKTDGKISDKPKYGEGDVSGYVEIVTSKNDAKTSTRVAITIKETSATEVLFDPKTFTMATVWNIIRGANSAYSNDSSSGHRNIKSNLNFTESYTCSLTDTPIQLSYSVTGGEIKVNEKKIVRMNETGVYTPVKYSDACTLIGVAYGASVSGLPNVRNVIIGELNIKVTLTLGEFTRDFIYNCATQSAQITNEEVLTALMGGILKYYTSTDADGSVKIPHPFNSSTSTISPEFTFTAVNDGHGEITVINCSSGGNGAKTLTIPSLKLSEGEVLLETSYEIKDIKGTGNYDDDMINRAFNGGVFVSNSDSSQSSLKFNFNDFYEVEQAKKQFSIACKVDVRAYGGDVLSGSKTVYARFAVNNSGLTDPNQ